MALTIDGLAELRAGLGSYIKRNQKEILRGLIQKIESTKHMTTIPSAITQYRAAQASIDSLVQGFQKGWTPKGTPKFTPIIIQNRRHKIDVTIDPDDIVEEWIGWLADEGKKRSEWPITKYIIENLVLPRVASDRELLVLSKGVYEPPVEGEAQETGKSVDGYLTVLQKEKANVNTGVNFMNIETGAGVPSNSNIVDYTEEFTDKIAFLYQHINMAIFMSPELKRAHMRKDRALHGNDPSFKGPDYNVYGTNQKIVALPGMAGSKIIFATPKNNFVHLINKNKGANRLFMDDDIRTVRLWADWWEAPGFKMGEAVFAANVDAFDAGSGSGGL